MPTAYRISINEAGGGSTQTALAGEVLHIRAGADVATPWLGQAPLRRASLTAGLLNTLERALAETYENAPLGSQVLPLPENAETDNEKLSRGFRGRRGGVLIRESVNVMAAGGAAPQSDWKPHDLSPDLQKSMTSENVSASRDAICAVFGVLPGMLNNATTGPMVREGQRHLAQWMLQPIAALISQEATEKLGVSVTLDVMRPLQAFDAGGRARTVTALVQALAQAKEAGVDPAMALNLVDWKNG